LCRLLKT